MKNYGYKLGIITAMALAAPLLVLASCEGYTARLPSGVNVRVMTFGSAITAMKDGHHVARSGWNGNGMFLYYVPENKYPASRNEHGTMVGVFEDDMVPYREYIALKTVDNQVVPWAPSISDALAEDWQIVE